MEGENTRVRGIVLYNIEHYENLNGVYTDNQIPNAKIFTETARRINQVNLLNDNIR